MLFFNIFLSKLYSILLYTSYFWFCSLLFTRTFSFLSIRDSSSKSHFWLTPFWFSRFCLFWILEFLNNFLSSNNPLTCNKLMIKRKSNVLWNLNLDRNIFKMNYIHIFIASVISQRHIHCENSSDEAWSFQADKVNRLELRCWVAVLNKWVDVDRDVCPCI